MQQGREKPKRIKKKTEGENKKVFCLVQECPQNVCRVDLSGPIVITPGLERSYDSKCLLAGHLPAIPRDTRVLGWWSWGLENMHNCQNQKGSLFWSGGWLVHKAARPVASYHAMVHANTFAVRCTQQKNAFAGEEVGKAPMGNGWRLVFRI